ncbi:MAG: IPExxxVDY family protein [Flavobacteriales bacterium]|nr:IPExxxVDY family protein [Flavobacteriales bacterium]MBK6944293.1 IPExxxVDY family protein [Flavobacteriales bacterium]MBK7240493.1 IPExxxVDY family protein [Flavobacteriales bacterium]MBK7295210.1 IPExxxVDY family protein [Flavobacteriales bacterium]MBK9533961.1 IPExxxVDY family protein [Flavobacteriales bacterium]
MAKVKLKLDIEPDPEVTVIGISCHEHDYRLCWAMNHAMELELTRRREDITEEVGGREAHFGVYDHVVHPDRGGYTLINNHGDQGVLIADQKNADYFLVVDNEVVEDVPDLVDRIRAAEFVLAAFNLPFDQLRNGHKLLR